MSSSHSNGKFITSCNGCGVETDYCSNFTSLIQELEGFDFVLAPLMDPTYRPSSVGENVSGSYFTRDIAMKGFHWSKHVMGAVSKWIDLDSEDEILRTTSAIILDEEIALAMHLSMQACLLPYPKNNTCENYARCLKKILKKDMKKDMKLLLRIPLVEDGNSPWELWQRFHYLCEHHSQLAVALELSMPVTSSLEHWFEPSSLIILQTEVFIPEGRHGVRLSECSENILTSFFDQKMLSTFFNHSAVKIVISAPPESPSNAGTSLPLESVYAETFLHYWEILGEQK